MADAQHATLELAKALLARPSVTPDDGGCVDMVAARLRAIGFVCERMDRNGVTNLWARRGNRMPLVCVAGHVDVVPTGPVEQWTSHPFTPTERNGHLYARGATDMKGPLAAAITAVERLVSRRPDHPGSVAVLLTSDEEGVARDGTLAVVDALRARGERITQCIVTESTSIETLGDGIKNGRRGSLNGVMTVRGKQCHIAYPQLGRNPIHEAAPALAELAAMTWDEGNEYFPPTSFQISNVHAGTGADNVIPGTMTVTFNFRFSPESTANELEARVIEVVARHKLDAEIEWRLSGQPFLTRRGPLVDVLTAAIRSVNGRTPELSTGGGTSDARFIATIADEVVEFGGLNSSMHMVDEHLRIADLGPLSCIYEAALEQLLDRPVHS